MPTFRPKTAALLAALALSSTPWAVAGAAEGHACHGGPDHTTGIHGMALFGDGDDLLASHLPLFRHPHDHQLVLELRLADPALAAEMGRRLGASPALWTLVPECLELDRLAGAAAGSPVRFRADLVEGHFERGGTTVHKAVEVEAVAAPMNARLDPAYRTAAAAAYRLVGRGERRFLVKRVGARPDFDHVVAVAVPPAAPEGAELAVPAEGVAEPAAGRLADALRRAAGDGARVVGTVYYDTQDLR